MCIAHHARYAHCPHTYFLEWTYCPLAPSCVPTAGKACRRYRRKTTGRVGGRAKECAECAMDRKIVEDFGEAALKSLGGRRAKKRRFWLRKGGEVASKFEEARDLQPMLGEDREAWPALEMTPLVLPGEDGSKYAEPCTGMRSRNSASLHSNATKDRGVMDWLRTSFGKR